ncbi:MAG: Peptide deformylase [Planctomycetota bacterium]|jgi:peptide deformylase
MPGSVFRRRSTHVSHPALEIHRYPHPVLARRAEPVDVVDDDLRRLAEAMIEVMYEADGVGLAAPQVGISRRMFVADPRRTDEPDPQVFINPEIRLTGDLVPFEEGCLSIPDVRVTVRRPQVATIVATGLDGEPFEMTDDDFAARVWQHEFDHLDGVLIVDRMSPRDRLAHRRTLKEMRAAFESGGWEG